MYTVLVGTLLGILIGILIGNRHKTPINATYAEMTPPSKRVKAKPIAMGVMSGAILGTLISLLLAAVIPPQEVITRYDILSLDGKDSAHSKFVLGKGIYGEIESRNRGIVYYVYFQKDTLGVITQKEIRAERVVVHEDATYNTSYIEVYQSSIKSPYDKWALEEKKWYLEKGRFKKSFDRAIIHVPAGFSERELILD